MKTARIRIMNAIIKFPRGSIAALLALTLLLNISGSTQAKAYHHEHTGCDTIHRILNGTSAASAAAAHTTQNSEGFLIDHDQWHNHKDCEYMNIYHYRHVQPTDG